MRPISSCTNIQLTKDMDLQTKSMSPDNPTQVLTTHDLSQLRTIQRVTNATVIAAPAQATNTITNGVRVINTTAQQQHQHGTSINIRVNNEDAAVSGGSGSRHQILTNPIMQQSASATASIVTTSTTSASHNLSNLLASAAAAASVSVSVTTAGKNSCIISGHHKNINNNIKYNNSHLTFAGGTTIVPTTPKYVLLPQNSNGQITPYGQIVSTNGSSLIPPTGSIVVLATEPLDNISNSNQCNSDGTFATTVGAAVCDNDEELRSLTWLNNSNLIKEIVTTTTTTTSGTTNATVQGTTTVTGAAIKTKQWSTVTNGNNNTKSIVSVSPSCATAANINRLTISNDLMGNVSPQSHQIVTVAALSEESINDNDRGNAETQQRITSPATAVTALNVGNIQKQFKRFNNLQELQELQDQSISLNNIAHLGATTMYVGPSGTTTVVEYKTAANLPISRQLLSGSITNGIANTSVSSTLKISNNNNSSKTSSSSLFVPSSLPVAVAVANNSDSNVVVNNSNSKKTSILPNSQCNVNNTIVTSVTATTTTTTSAATATITTIKGAGSKQHFMLPNHTTILVNGGTLTAVENNTNNHDNSNHSSSSDNHNSNLNNHSRNNGHSNQLKTTTTYHGHKHQQERSITSAVTAVSSIGSNFSSKSNSNTYNKSNNNSGSSFGSANGNITSSLSSSGSSTTHHPHKKYLREKMNVLDKGGGYGIVNGNGNGNGNGNDREINGDGLLDSATTTILTSDNIVSIYSTSTANANTNSDTLIFSGSHNYPTIITSSSSPLLNAGSCAITVVSSPASSNSSLSTAAVNGGNSPPLNKTLSFFTLSANNAPIALNYPSGNLGTVAAATELNITPFTSATMPNMNSSPISFSPSSHASVSTAAHTNTSPATTFINYSDITSNQIPVGYTLVSHPIPTTCTATAIATADVQQHRHKLHLQNNHHNAIQSLVNSTAIEVVSTITTTTTTTTGSIATATASLKQQQQHQNGIMPLTSSPTIVTLSEMQAQPNQMQHNTTKEYIITSQQQQQQQLLHGSPTSHSSYENDSLKDFEIITDTQIKNHYHNNNNNNTNSNSSQSSSPNSAQHHQQQKQQYPKGGQTLPSNDNNIFSGVAPATPQKQKHPNNVPYDPLVHTHNKPPYSFSSLIFMAIEDSQEKALPVKEIYAWIVQHFPYFKTAPTGWKNSVRHNLSLNKSFVKIEKAPNMGKGSLWRVEQQQRQNLIQALNRSPFFQNAATIDKLNAKSPGSNGCGGSNSVTSTSSPVDLNSYDVVDGDGSGDKKTQNTTINVIATTAPTMTSRFDPILFPHLTKAFKDISDGTSDAPDDEGSLDYNSSASSAIVPTTIIITTTTATATTTTHRHTSLSPGNQSNKCNGTSYLIKNNAKNSNNNCKNNKHQNDHQKLMAINKGDRNMNTIINGVVGVDSGSCRSDNICSININSSTSPVHLNSFNQYDNMERLARDCGADSIDDVNAATAMLALKHGPKVFVEPFQNGAPVITSSPSEDHTYSAGGMGISNKEPSLSSLVNNSITNGNAGGGDTKTNGLRLVQTFSVDHPGNCASSDAAYESSEEYPNVSADELEDQKRHRDGVDALLSLSLFSTMETEVTSIQNSQTTFNHNTTSPNKRPPTTTIEEEHHLSTILNNNNNNSNNKINKHYNGNTYHVVQPHNMSKVALLSAVAASNNTNDNNNNNNNKTFINHNSNKKITTTSTSSDNIANNHNNNRNNYINSRILLSPSSKTPNANTTTDEGYNTASYFGNHSIASTGGVNNHHQNHHNQQQQQQQHQKQQQHQQSQQHYRRYPNHHNSSGGSSSNSTNSNSSMHNNASAPTMIVGGGGGVKKPKPLRSLRTKIKRKAPWMR